METLDIIVQLISLIALPITVYFAYKTVRLSKKQLYVSQKPELLLIVPNFLYTDKNYEKLTCHEYDKLSSVWYGRSRDGSNPRQDTNFRFINGGKSSAFDIQVFLFCDIASLAQKLVKHPNNDGQFGIKYSNGNPYLYYESPKREPREKKVGVVFNSPERSFQIPFITASGESEKAVMEIPHLYLNFLNLALQLDAYNNEDFKVISIELPPILLWFKYKNLEGHEFNNYSKCNVTHIKKQDFLCTSNPIRPDEFKALTKMCNVEKFESVWGKIQ